MPEPTYRKTGDHAVAQYAEELKSLNHTGLALWAAACAEHVLSYFENTTPGDDRPRRAVEAARAWARGEISMMDARAVAVRAHAAARECVEPAATAAARASGHAVATAHSKAHAREAAAYSILAVAFGVADREAERVRDEQQWQKKRLKEFGPK